MMTCWHRPGKRRYTTTANCGPGNRPLLLMKRRQSDKIVVKLKTAVQTRKMWLHERLSLQSRNWSCPSLWLWWKSCLMAVWVHLSTTRKGASEQSSTTALRRLAGSAPQGCSFGNALDDHVAKLFDNDAAAEGWWRVFSPEFIHGACWNFRYLKIWNINKWEEVQCCLCVKKLMDTLKTFNDGCESAPTRYDSRSDELPCRKSSERCLKRLHTKPRNKDVHRHLSSSTVHLHRRSTTLARKWSPRMTSNWRKRHVHYHESRAFGMNIDSPDDRYESSRGNRNEVLGVIRPVIDHFSEAFNYIAYRLADKSFHYDT